MRVVVQRVMASSVTVDGEIAGKIGQGLTLLVGIAPTDTAAELSWMARKCLDLRLFPSLGSDGQRPAQEGHRWDLSVRDIQGEILVVSQFTLYGDCRKGRRPSFDGAAPPAQAEALYNDFVSLLHTSGLRVETGKFGAMMQVKIHNDGPVTLLLEREAPA
ncbi:D-aminoacyl-tRNA deacylase [Leptolyngbya sp. CCNP1308]|uniref:D-aminoacyl-tRNA deacylase n=1 Tax=Leptolyngbya sp. CCNP1308 TaxID=3110255 RepID=UPI002B1F9C20|nr:D-aminoacyl-tRNA deacylase [Leptolyngbya sp. CCNP1308]MEA5447239.1 D-aminoacyl-tRNA deacylase [Leptolyngbya sp. CCNP1308]